MIIVFDLNLGSWSERNWSKKRDTCPVRWAPSWSYSKEKIIKNFLTTVGTEWYWKTIGKFW